ncbi:YaeQ family protein [Pseudoalteromonas aurantia]|uniref:YaeQ family protein n=1 Tax=Pseudoalteromonas aurantia TaxID=43654 RepID=A0A5S3V7A7_9GAMM|nr:YaeQ family protein [Pseudoalteromonas aurantia]TMO62043.1 hypothetical protein CWC18_10755 [Pseudoalteromonas aurantia]TMO67639.1 hypothetical protein CWC19_12915 [Pseudoalteromonas aurantia]TMO78470.1 hypothetical protein CWC20_01650 [Pseudoalteromonas aurantia]
MTKPFVFKARVNVADLFHHANHQEVFTTALQKSESLAHFVLKIVGLCAISYEQSAHLNTHSDRQKPDVWLEDDTGYITLALYASELELEEIARVAKLFGKVVILSKQNPTWFSEISERIHIVENVSIFSLEPQFVESLSGALSRSLHWDVVIEQNQLSVSDKNDYYETQVTQLV